MMQLIISALLQVFIMTLIPLIWWLITGRKENFFKWLGFKKVISNTSAIKVFLITIVVSAIYIISIGLVMNTFLKDVESATSQFTGKGIQALPAILVYAIIQTSLSEEIFFRGFLGKRLINKFGFTIGNSIQALCFGLLHGIPFFILSNNLVVLVFVTILPCLIGYYQGYLNEKLSGGSILPSWLMHAILNILSAAASAFGLII